MIKILVPIKAHQIQQDKKTSNTADTKDHDSIVFLSEAASKFKKEVSNLNSVKQHKDIEIKVNAYNKAVKKLDSPILDFVKNKPQALNVS